MRGKPRVSGSNGPLPLTRQTTTHTHNTTMNIDTYLPTVAEITRSSDRYHNRMTARAEKPPTDINGREIHSNHSKQLHKSFPFEVQYSTREGAEHNDRFANYLFPSVADFAAYCLDKGAFRNCGDEGLAKTIQGAMLGDETHVPAAAALMREIEDKIDLAALARHWQPAVAGSYPNVPDFLSNEPQCMRKMSDTYNDTGLIRIYNCISCSSGIEGQQQIKRGLATIALVQALQMTGRPVELYVLDINPTGNVLIKVATNPMVLSELCFTATSSDFVRNLMYPFIHKLGHEVAWPAGMEYPKTKGTHGCLDTPEELERKLKVNQGIVRDVIGAKATDLCLAPSIYGDTQMFNDPAAWVLKQIEAVKAATDAESF